MSLPKFPVWLIACLALLAGLSGASLASRFKVERQNRAAGLMLEWQTIADLAAGSGVPLPDALARLKASGLTGVAISEESIQDLVDRGTAKLILEPGDSGAWRAEISPSELVPERVPRTAGDPKSLLARGVGINPVTVELVKQAGLLPVARHANALGMTEGDVHALIGEDRALGIAAYLPSGDQVVGHRTAVGALIEALRGHGLHYLSPEFVKIAGDAKVKKEYGEGTIKLHSIQQAEADRMAPAEFYERFRKAYRERNNRWMLVRPLSPASASPINALAETLAGLKRVVESEGGAVRAPRPFEDPTPNPALFTAIGLVAVPVLLWFGFQLVAAVWLRALGTVVVLALCSGGWLESARPFLALALAVAVPSIGYLWLTSRTRSQPLLEYAVISAMSLAGGLAVAGLLNGLPYMIQAAQFPGVKAATFLPVAIAGWVLVRRTGVASNLGAKPVLWGSAIIGFALAGLFGLIFLRTGNDNPAAVSGMELRFRDLLDKLLYTRPRTKEFLFGHPALALGLCLWRGGSEGSRLGWATLLLTAGAIGQTGIVNTLCHLHTPLDVSLARIGLGWALGGIIGSLLWLGIRSRAVGSEGNQER